MKLSYQIAQKLHAVSEPGSEHASPDGAQEFSPATCHAVAHERRRKRNPGAQTPPKTRTLKGWRDDISESVPIHKISYIILTGRGRYDIHLTDGKILSLRSVLFRDLKRVLKEQNITSLRPVSRNEIININYISKITKSPNGRLSVTVIGNDLSPFHIGTGYEKFFADEFL